MNTEITLGVKDRFDAISRVVCEKCGVEKRQLTSNSRKAHLVFARFLVMRFCVDYIERLSTRSIGSLLGERDHSTVIKGLKRLENLLTSHIEDKVIFDACDKQIRFVLHIMDEPDYQI